MGTSHLFGEERVIRAEGYFTSVSSFLPFPSLSFSSLSKITLHAFQFKMPSMTEPRSDTFRDWIHQEVVYLMLTSILPIFSMQHISSIDCSFSIPFFNPSLFPSNSVFCHKLATDSYLYVSFSFSCVFGQKFLSYGHQKDPFTMSLKVSSKVPVIWKSKVF